MADELKNVGESSMAGAVSGSAAGPLGAMAGAAVGAAGSFLGNLAMNSVEQSDYRQNQRANFKYSQLAQMNAARNTKESFERAGMSPAVLANGNFAPASMTNAPVQNKAVSPLETLQALDVAARVRGIDSQSSLNAATAEKTRQEAEEIKLRNDTAKDSRVMTNHALQESFTVAISNAETTEQKESLQSLLDTLTESPYASPESIKRALDLQIAVAQIPAITLARKMESKTYAEQLEAEIYKDNAQLPRATLRKLTEEINYTIAVIEKTKADTIPNAKQVEYMNSQINNLRQQIKESKARLPLIEAQTKANLGTAVKAVAESKKVKAEEHKVQSEDDRHLINNGEWYWATYNKLWKFLTLRP